MRVDSPPGRAPVPADAPETAGPGRLYRWIADLIFVRPFWQLLVGLAGINVLKDGMWGAPELPDWADMARSFPRNPHLAGSHAFILSSPIGPAIAHVLGATSAGSFEAFSLLVVLLAVSVTLLGLRRRAGPAAARLGAVALFASPLSNILFTWLGKEDPFLVLGAALIMLFDWPPLTILGGLILGTANPEAGAAMAVIAVLLRGHEASAKRAGTYGALFGLCSGFWAVAIYDVGMNVPVGGRVSFVEQTGAHTLLRQFLAELPTWAFTVFGAWWITLAAFWRHTVERRRTAVVLVVMLLVVASLSAASVDQTRIFALVSLPAVLWFVVRSVQTVPEDQLQKFTTWTLIAALLLPRLIVQEGNTYVSHLSFILPHSI